MVETFFSVSGRIGVFAMVAAGLVSCTGGDRRSWDPAAAAARLDQRAARWLSWGPATRQQGTACMSCHTTLPYLLARAAVARDSDPLPVPEQRLLASVVKRVQSWNNMRPYYLNQGPGSRGTEAVLNALVLAEVARQRPEFAAAAAQALEFMWAEQVTTGPEAGSWHWISFDEQPWEAADSAYYGAVLAVLAAAATPVDYRGGVAVQARLESLRAYLMREYPRQTLLNRVQLLWADNRLPGLMTAADRQALVDEIWAQQHADGGWSTAALLPGWKRADGRPVAGGSDGYATAFVTMVLGEAGVPPVDRRLRSGLAWLQHNQSRWNGGWPADSPNHSHWIFDTTRYFMGDAATAFAVMALTGPWNPVRQAARFAAAPEG